MNFFPKVNRWFIPAAALDQSRDEMALDGRHGKEGISLWLGTKHRGEVHVTHIVFLRGSGLFKSPVNIRIASPLMHEVHEHAEGVGAILIGQVHSHGRAYGIDLSPSDHAYGIACSGIFSSIVWPDYAQTQSTTISDCGVHIFLPNRGYVRLTDRQVAKKIVVSPEPNVAILTAGVP